SADRRGVRRSPDAARAPRAGGGHRLGPPARASPDRGREPGPFDFAQDRFPRVSRARALARRDRLARACIVRRPGAPPADAGRGPGDPLTVAAAVRAVLMGAPDFFSIRGGANPHTRTALGLRKRGRRHLAIEQWHGFASLLTELDVAVYVVPADPLWPGL